MSSAPLSRPLIRGARIRAMRYDDVPAVVDVERASYFFPWSDSIFRDCIRVGYVCRVVLLDHSIVGYGVLSYGAGEAHVLNVCIREDLRGGGLGRRMMEVLLEHARSAGMEFVFLEVRPSNPTARRLYESMGFDRVGVRKSYYQAVGGREDALVYRLALTDNAAHPGTF